MAAGLTFRALACDYDGTLAVHDRLTAAAIEAVQRARGAGLVMILVTGRTLFELTRTCERLDLFDVVVAENGGVLYFPLDGAVRDAGPPPSPRLLAELDRRGVPFDAGRVVVATTRSHEAAVREALEAADAPLQVVVNRAALMVLPAFISKGTGVATALAALGLSARDVLGIGDAENDLALFEACGWSACPEDAVPELRARADWVLPGAGPPAVARAIAGAIVEGTLPPPRSVRHLVPLGWASRTSEPIGIPVRGVNLLVVGDPLSGKSSLVGGLVERIAASGDAVCVIDPEGDYEVLRGLPQAAWAEIRREGAWDEVMAAFVKNSGATAVADLTALPHEAKVALAARGLARLRALRQRRGVPHWIVIDEAHYLLHEGGIPAGEVGMDGKGICLATYRGSWLAPAVLAAMDVVIVGRTTEPRELAFVAGLPTAGALVARIAASLPGGDFVLQRAGAAPVTFMPATRTIAHVRHLLKYTDHGVAPVHRFVFRSADGQEVALASTLAEFHQALGDVDAAVLTSHASRGDFSRWLREVLSAGALAARFAKLERRCVRGEVVDVRASLRAILAPLLGAAARASHRARPGSAA
jgi:hydroxymethylpyrimidine pyrophosphatase-like HAD family hydrolase